MQAFFIGMWWAILVRGLASVVFGILAFVYPGITLGVLVTIFGVYALLDGAATLWAAFRKNGSTRTFAAAFQGVVSILVGIFCLAMPAVAVVYVVILIGLWNIAVGLLQVGGAIAVRGEVANTSLIAAGGVLSVILGAIIVLYPAAGAVSVVWIIGATAVIVGLVLIHFALKLRQVAKTVR